MILRNDLLRGLNENQKKAVISDNKRILCLAGAGSGKTEVITRKTAYMLKSRISPRNIACITFTRAAGKEMKKRINSIDNEKGKDVFCNTFHKFCIEILNKYGYRIGISPNFSIINQEERDRVLGEISLEFNYKYKSKDVNKIIVKYEDYENKTFKEKEIVDTYITYMRENNSCDIEMLQYFAFYLLKEYKDVKAYYHNTYKYISIDEYQDTNNIQNLIIDEINPEYLFVVGDNRQAIYGFRGANIEHILSFKEKYKEADVIQLINNYRSTDKIVAASNNLISHAKNQISDNMIANKQGSNILFINSENEELQARNIVLTLTSYEDIDYSDMAIVSRTNKELDYIAKYLDDMKVPYVRNIKDTFPNEYLLLFSNLQNVENSTKLYSLLKKVDIISEEELKVMKIKSLESGISLFNYMKNIKEGAPKEFIKVLNDIKVTSNLYEYMQKACRLFSLNFNDIKEHINSWINEQLELGEKRISINDFIKDMYLDSSKKINDDGISLVTVHGSKGLEWHTTVVIGLNESNFPQKRGDEEEERRMAYVAFTRAKEKLILSSYENGYDFKKQPIKLEKSKFLDEIN